MAGSSQLLKAFHVSLHMHLTAKRAEEGEARPWSALVLRLFARPAMSFLEVEHAGEQYSLTVKDTTLHLAPISGSLGSLPSSLDIPSIAFAILASNSNSDELTSLTIVHLSSPSDSSALPAVHSIALTSQHDASSFTSHPALGALFLPPAAQYATLHLIINPAAGARTASAYHAQVVAPLLELAGVKAEVHETKAVDDAGVIAREIVKQAKGEKVVLGLLGGDGTTHEALNGLLLGEDERGQLSKPPGDVEVVIV